MYVGCGVGGGGGNKKGDRDLKVQIYLLLTFFLYLEHFCGQDTLELFLEHFDTKKLSGCFS